MDEIVLKPCPFCGSTPHVAEMFVGTPYGDGYTDFSIAIECRCGVTLEKEHTTGPDGNPLPLSITAFDAWNRRAEPPMKPLSLAEIKELPVPCVAILEDKVDMSIRPVTIWRVEDLAIYFRGDSGLWMDEYGITKRLWRCGTFRNPTDEERSAAKWTTT